MSSKQSWADFLLKLRSASTRPTEDQLFLVLTLIIGAVVGLTVVAFVALTERLGEGLVTANRLERFLFPVGGSLVSGLLLYYFFPGARGSGIPQTRFALLLQRGFIPFRTVVGKFLCSSLSLGSGVALGREGPSVHMGAGVASVIGRRMGLSDEKVRSLIPVGTAAAVAAAFNTPLAAVLFTLEEILADMHARVVGSVVLGSATSWIVLRLLLGDEPLFHVPSYQLVHPVEFAAYAVLGLLGGLVSAGFVRVLLRLRAFYLQVPERWRPWLPASGGVFVGLIAIFVPGVLGAGYHLVGEALDSKLALTAMVVLLAAKVFGTAMCYSSGNAGGIFGPSLFIGAMLGGAVGQVTHSLLPDFTASAGAYALVGMGAAFAGIVRTPMTSVIMIFEVTRDYSIIVPLMIANLCSFLVSRRFQAIPIYQALQKQEGVEMPSEENRAEPLLVERAMRFFPTSIDPEALPGAPVTVYPDDPLDLALRRLGATRAEELPVLTRTGGKQIGAIGAADALRAYGLGSDPSAPPPEVEPAVAKNWLPALAGSSLFVLMLVGGIVYWQRSHQASAAQDAYRTGTELSFQGRADEAAIRFRAALSIMPSNSTYRSALGLALVRTGHPEEALGHLQQALKASPADPLLLLGIARAYVALGNRLAANPYYVRAIASDWPADATTSRKDARLEYARVLQAEGKTSEAVLTLQALVEELPSDLEASMTAASKMEELGALDTAIETWQLLTRRFPQNANIRVELGRSRLAAGRITAASDAFRLAVNLDPNHAGAARELARTEELLSQDPTLRRLPFRQRVARTTGLLRRLLAHTGQCLTSEDRESLETMVAHPPRDTEQLEEQWAAVSTTWKSSRSRCHEDPSLDWFARILTR